MSGVWAPLRAELDTDPPRDPALGLRPYVVCSTPRSGSGLLCRALAAGGRAGQPAEYLNPNQRVPLSARWDTGDDLAAYVDALTRRRVSPDGVVGTKLHWDQLDALLRETGAPADGPPYAPSAAPLERLLPGVRYVHIARLDLDRQAVSLWTALHRGLWSLPSGAARPASAAAEVPYDGAGLERCRRFVADGELRWERFFRANGIEPVRVTYEQLVADPAPVVRTVLAVIAGQQAAAAPVAPLDGQVLADAGSEALLARFRAERAGRDGSAPVPAPAAIATDGPAADAARGLAPGERRAVTVTMQADGNLVVTGADGVPCWSTATHGHPGARAAVEDGGRLVVRAADGTALWISPPSP